MSHTDRGKQNGQTTRSFVLAVDRGEGLAGQANIVTMYQLCHLVSHTFTQTHTQNTALNMYVL